MAQQIQKYTFGEFNGHLIPDKNGAICLYKDVAPLLEEALKPLHNTGSPKLPPSCAECVLVKICHVSPGYGMPLCKDTWQQLRERLI